MMRQILAILGLTAIVGTLGGCGGAGADGDDGDTIVIGQISNRTGATSDVGVPLADGVRHAWQWINENGGVRGRQVRLVERECGYSIRRTVAAFEELGHDYGVPLIHGFGTPDSEAVRELATAARIIYMPTSYAEEFVDPDLAPYFFITNTDYSTAARSAVQYVAEHGGSLGLARASGGFGMAPIGAIKDEAEQRGVDIVAEEDIDYTPTDGVQQALALRRSGATHVWMGNTSAAMAILARDMRRQDVDATIIGNIYAGDEVFLNRAGDDAEGHLALYGSVPYGDTSAEAMDAIMATDYNDPNTHYIRGWAQALLAAEVIGRAIDEGLELNGENLRDMFHTVAEFSPGGLIPPVSYEPDDHRPSTAAPLYQVQDGEWVKIWDGARERE